MRRKRTAPEAFKHVLEVPKRDTLQGKIVQDNTQNSIEISEERRRDFIGGLWKKHSAGCRWLLTEAHSY
ncbi:MAG TPA: hypothetical protein DCE56_26990 [Cyanobacteria bacterium UBA8553]|nr:hypothetical protein [Cyanobacteria bacterium UBA8553]